MLRIRTVQWSVLTGLVAWMPFMIVVFKAAFGVDTYVVLHALYVRHSLTWVWGNVAFGLALIPLAIWVSRKFGDRPMIQALMRSLAGYNLNAAADFLATLSEFEEEKRDN